MNCCESGFNFSSISQLLTHKRKGIADEELARKEAERRTARGREGELFTNGSRKRSRSLSSLTSTSVSTISTGISRSPSPFNGDKGRTGQSQRMSTLNVDRKRRRSGSSMSYSSRSSLSPPRRYGEHESSGRPYRRAKSRGRWSRSRSSSPGRRRNQRSRSGDRGKRRRRASRSPIDRGRHRDSRASRGDRRSKSLSSSRDRSQVIRNRKSMTPSIASKPPERLRHGRHRPSIDRNSSYSDDHERYGSSARTRNGEATATSFPSRRQEPPRERSLSPFSKRLALTQAMNMGR